MTPRQRFLLIVPGVLFLVAFGAFELGRWGGEKIADRKHSAKARAELKDDLTQDDRALMKTLLAQNLGERTFEFTGVIAASTGKTVRPFDPAHPPSATILGAISAAADTALNLHNRPGSPVRGLRRINEASRYFEETLRSEIDAHPGLFCTIPETADGTGQRSGYPDLRIEHAESGVIVYLDPKLFEASSRGSSLRSFYYTPRSKSSKVLDDASHLLLGISHNGADGNWTFTGWEVIDLSKLQVRLKAEFQAANRDIYRDDGRIAASEAVE